MRVAALVGLGASAFLLLRYPPATRGDIIAGVVGLCIGIAAALGRRPGKPLDGAAPRG